ncbi:hypothetical protein CLOSTASPAR_04222, partial [[Clostridium] asparagiforme DSM 15981]
MVIVSFLQFIVHRIGKLKIFPQPDFLSRTSACISPAFCYNGIRESIPK